MKVETEKPKQAALERLTKKIEDARAEVESAVSAAQAAQERILGRIRDDGAGRCQYSSETLKENRNELVELERQREFAQTTLQCLEDVLPEVSVAATREEMGGLDAALGDLDGERLVPALEGFIVNWNRMCGSYAILEALFAERGETERHFLKLARSIEDKATPIVAPCCKNGVYNVLASMLEFFLGRDPGRRILPEGIFRRKTKTADPRYPVPEAADPEGGSE